MRMHQISYKTLSTIKPGRKIGLLEVDRTGKMKGKENVRGSEGEEGSGVRGEVRGDGWLKTGE